MGEAEQSDSHARVPKRRKVPRSIGQCRPSRGDKRRGSWLPRNRRMDTPGHLHRRGSDKGTRALSRRGALTLAWGPSLGVARSTSFKATEAPSGGNSRIPGWPMRRRALHRGCAWLVGPLDRQRSSEQRRRGILGLRFHDPPVRARKRERRRRARIERSRVCSRVEKKVFCRSRRATFWPREAHRAVSLSQSGGTELRERGPSARRSGCSVSGASDAASEEASRSGSWWLSHETGEGSRTCHGTGNGAGGTRARDHLSTKGISGCERRGPSRGSVGSGLGGPRSIE